MRVFYGLTINSRFTLIRHNRLMAEPNQRMLDISRGAITSSQHLQMVAMVQAILATINAIQGNDNIVEGPIECRIGLESAEAITVRQRQPLDKRAIHHQASIFAWSDVIAALVIKKVRMVMNGYRITVGVVDLRLVAVYGEQFKLQASYKTATVRFL